MGLLKKYLITTRFGFTAVYFCNMNRQKELQKKKKAFWEEKMTPLYVEHLGGSQLTANSNISREEWHLFSEECSSWKIPNLSMELKQDWKHNVEKIDFYITKTKVLSLNYPWSHRLELLDYLSYFKSEISAEEPLKLYHFLVGYTQIFCESTKEWQQKRKQFWKEKRQQELAIKYISEALGQLQISHFVKTHPSYFSLHINIKDQQIEIKLPYNFIVKNIHRALPTLSIFHKLLTTSGIEFQTKQVYRNL